MKRHILILAFCKHDDISFFVSVRLCMLGRSVKTNNAFALCKQKDVLFYLNFYRRGEI